MTEITDPPAEDSAESQGSAVPYAGLVRGMVAVEKTLAALFLFLIVGFMGVQVFARYVFGAPFSGSEEAARLALIWMTFVAASFVMAEGRHITVDLISHRFAEGGKLRLEIFSHLVVAGTCLLLAIGGSRFVYYVGKVGSPSLGVPKSYWYGAVIAGLLLMAFHSMLNLMQVLKTGRPLERDTSVSDDGFQLELEDGK